jgi:DNA-directed RNA polymerase specialized sigma24 family protein
MRPSTARRHLPDAHRRALELRALDLESTDVAARLGIEVSAVEPLFAVATAKLAALESLQEPEDAPDPSPNARGTHR